MHHFEYLRRLCIDGDQLDEGPPGEGPWDASAPSSLDRKTCRLVRLGVLVAALAAEPSIRREVDDAVSEGATASEIVDVLEAILPLVGRPRVVSAAPKVALALGEDLDLLAGDA